MKEGKDEKRKKSRKYFKQSYCKDVSKIRGKLVHSVSLAMSVLSGDVPLILISLLPLGGVAHRLVQLVGLRLKDKRRSDGVSQAVSF